MLGLEEEVERRKRWEEGEQCLTSELPLPPLKKKKTKKRKEKAKRKIRKTKKKQILT